MEKECGLAGEGIMLLMKGACGEKVSLEDAYRCTGCGKWFHLNCIFNHFEQEEEQDNSRYYLKKIQERTKDNQVKRYCRLGLKRKKPTVTFPF